MDRKNGLNHESTNRNESDPGCGCNMITISVNPTTGGHFELEINKNISIETLKKIISKKLKVPKERICLLYRERQLRDGSVEDHEVRNGSRLTLLPSVETGLLAQRPEQSVMQALESLNDGQVNDFLSGKAPLNLTMRLGDHMMLIQLQLSTVTPSNSNGGATSTSSSQASTASSSSSASSKPFTNSLQGSKRFVHPASAAANPKSPPQTPASSSSSQTQSKPICQHVPSFHHKDPLASLSSIIERATSPPSGVSKSSPPKVASADREETNCPKQTKSELPSDDLAAKNSRSTQTIYTMFSEKRKRSVTTQPSTSSNTNASLDSCTCDPPGKPSLDTRALAEASRNLTQTLKQLSSEVMTSKADPVEDIPINQKRRQGAIIESMHHHGKGVYSGTFSGTLNPALQDRFGRPKRDISTIIHILNDLLCATPQYRNCRVNNTAATATTSTSTAASKEKIEQTPKSSSNESDVQSINSADSLENQATRGKMERLRLIMEERRQKRRAARAAPYSKSPNSQEIGPHINNIEGMAQWSTDPQRNSSNGEPMETDICSTPEVSPEPVVA